MEADAEITLEANPGTFEQSKFAAFRAIGIDRLSIGIQSFDERFLKALGRVHDGAEAQRATEIARANFGNFNLDLMYGLPGQSVEEALRDVSLAVASGATHVSAYHLTIEPNTYFHRFPPALPDDDETAAMQEGIEAALAHAGFEHYETSAFARPGRRARHNGNYWSFGDYLGIGAGAHGKLSFRDRVIRQMRYKHPRDYMDRALSGSGAAVQTDEEIELASFPFEFMMNALRFNDGFALSLFADRTGLAVERILLGLARAEKAGLIERDHERVQPTLRGRRFLNDLLQIFLP
jgi:oxygen-independent coproporphyrinogen-3 oxidase